MECEELNHLICLVVPDDEKEKVIILIEKSQREEVERLKTRAYGKPSSSADYGRKNCEDEFEERAKYVALPLAIAQVIMEVWSPAMRNHAEELILEKAIQEKYLDKKHKKFVCVLNEKADEGWKITDRDDVIIDLIWNRYNIKKHFELVSSHRQCVNYSYQRLKEFVPDLAEEIIERHDLTKCAFNQAVGYTLRWVHNTFHPIWKNACDLHLHNEPHHQQMWSNQYSQDVKRQKLDRWMKDVCDFHNGCSRGYTLDITNHDLRSEDFARPFLLESYIDMVAVEWERKKGYRNDISKSELAYMEDRFLLRYTVNQFKIIKELMNRIMASDDSYSVPSSSQKRKSSEGTEAVDLSQLSHQERKLLSTVPREKQDIVALQLTQQKKEELKRLQLCVTDRQSAEAEKKEADDAAYYIMLGNIVMNEWSEQLRMYVQSLILHTAITEGFIKEDHLKWISVVEQRGRSVVDPVKSLDVTVEDSELVQLIWIDFNMREHFSQVASHRYWVMQTFLRLSSFIPALPEEVIERHDLSKLAFSQAIGYTLMMVHDINHPIWKTAYNRHMHGEPHHPELWSNRHTPEYKVSCLESWLCAEAGDPKYGVQANHLNFYSDNMPIPFLLESLIDVVAIEWERKKGKRLDITNAELVTVADRAFNRHTEADYRYVKAVIKKISDPSVV